MVEITEPSEVSAAHNAWKASLIKSVGLSKTKPDAKISIQPAAEEWDIIPDYVPSGELLQQEERTAEAMALAHIDALTRIPNRRALDEMIELVKKDGLSNVGVLFIDINDFRRFNKKFSQAIGDHILRLVAQAIGVNIDAGDIEFRYGGEEFVVLLKNVKSQDIVNIVGERLEKIFNQSDGKDAIGMERMSQSIAIGGIHISQTQDLASEIAKAEIAMKKAKRKTKRDSKKNNTWILCQRGDKTIRLPQSKYLPFVAAK